MEEVPDWTADDAEKEEGRPKERPKEEPREEPEALTPEEAAPMPQEEPEETAAEMEVVAEPKEEL